MIGRTLQCIGIRDVEISFAGHLDRFSDTGKAMEVRYLEIERQKVVVVAPEFCGVPDSERMDLGMGNPLSNLRLVRSSLSLLHFTLHEPLKPNKGYNCAKPHVHTMHAQRVMTLGKLPDIHEMLDAQREGTPRQA
jgi:hypothetical protein